MSWKAVGQPTVRKQRDKWTVRIDGIDTATGKERPRQIGTYASQQRARRGARVPRQRARHRTWHGQLARPPLRRGQVRHHTEAGEQFSWAIPHIESELGAMPLS